MGPTSPISMVSEYLVADMISTRVDPENANSQNYETLRICREYAYELRIGQFFFAAQNSLRGMRSTPEHPATL